MPAGLRSPSPGWWLGQVGEAGEANGHRSHRLDDLGPGLGRGLLCGPLASSRGLLELGEGGVAALGLSPVGNLLAQTGVGPHPGYGPLRAVNSARISLLDASAAILTISLRSSGNDCHAFSLMMSSSAAPGRS